MTSVDSTEPAEDFPAQKCGSCDGGPARCWCVDCSEALCRDCVSAHRRVTVTRRHKLLNQAPPEVFSISPTKFCSLHPSEALRLFCFRCNQITCRDCQLLAHQNHSFEFINKAVKSLKKQLGASIQPLQEQMKASSRSIVEMEEQLAVLTQQETLIQTKLRRNFSNLAVFLSKRLEKVLKEVQKIHACERQQIQTRMLKVRELQHGCMAVSCAAAQAQNTTDLLELLGCMAQIKSQVKELVSQDSAPPETMASLKVVADQKSMESILQFGKIEVCRVPFSTSQNPKKDSSSLHEVAPPTTSSSYKDIPSPTSSSFRDIAPPTSSSTFSNVAPPTCFGGTAPPTSTSAFSHIAPPTCSSITGSAPATSSLTLSNVDPPTSFSTFSNVAPPTSCFGGTLLPTSFSSFLGTAPPVSLLSFHGIAPPTSSFFWSGVAPPSFFSFFNSIAPPTSSHPLLGGAYRICSSQPPPAQTQSAPSSLVSSSVPDPPGVTPPQMAAASSKVRINVINRSEVAALSQWPIRERDPPQERPRRSAAPRSRRHRPKNTRSPGVSTAPQSRSRHLPCSPPITPVSGPDDQPPQQPSGPPLPGPPPSPLRERDPPPTPPKSRDRPPSPEELNPDPDSQWENRPGPCREGAGISPAAEPAEPVPPQTPEPSLSVEPEPAQKPGSPSAVEPSSPPCGGPDGGIETRGGGAPPGSAHDQLLQPRVSLFRLPVSWSGPDRRLPRFRLTLGDAEDEIYMQEIAQSPPDIPSSPLSNLSCWYHQNSDHSRDYTEPLSLEIPSCSSCGASDASKICVSCGRGYHQDCHVPPVGPDIWSEWICSLCQDLSDPTDPFSSDRPAGPQTSGLGLLDQRKCETLLLHLLVESCARQSESGFLLDLIRISERLTCRARPGFQRAEELVSELWTLMEESCQDGALNDLRESFQRKMQDVFGSELPPLLRRASNTPPRGGGGACSPTHGASGPKEVGADPVKARGEAERTGRRSKLEVLRRRLRDFLDMKQLPPGKRMKTD